ncbi:hypothetical protein [Borrelia sp. RT5S]|uniref:hypothetical protein n=1 Tax=Borrelia sp. RT5S TaxID=2898581 RepID=UPI001E3EFA98|nr:hypothetical protein [Borrelia sp. RT5S]UGQ16737.1 hypothetical protein LSO06_05300 [Borrelia sp. RT5S]
MFKASEAIYKTEYFNKYSNETVLDMYKDKYGMSKGFLKECIDEFTKFIKENHKENFKIVIDYRNWYAKLRGSQKKYLIDLEEKGRLSEDQFYGINFARDYLEKMHLFYLKTGRLEKESRQEYNTSLYTFFLLYNGAVISALRVPFDTSSKEFFIQVYKGTFNFFKSKYYRLKEITEVSKLLKRDKSKNAALLKNYYMRYRDLI